MKYVLRRRKCDVNHDVLFEIKLQPLVHTNTDTHADSETRSNSNLNKTIAQCTTNYTQH